MIGVGVIGGLGINVGHELTHKLNFRDRLFGKILLVSVCYGHFFVEHVYGHHKRVSTPEDPATAKCVAFGARAARARPPFTLTT